MKQIIKKGDKFGRLTAIRFVEMRGTNQCWLFKCDCGKEKIIKVWNVKTGHTKSCGCLDIKQRILNLNQFKHGMCETRAYASWSKMKQRCLNKNATRYKDWGGRGIKVCSEWLNFKNFFADMGERPKNKSLDRVDNDGNYCKNNCRYATSKEQNNNKRNNHLIKNI